MVESVPVLQPPYELATKGSKRIIWEGTSNVGGGEGGILILAHVVVVAVVLYFDFRFFGHFLSIGLLVHLDERAVQGLAYGRALLRVHEEQTLDQLLGTA